MRPMVCAYCDSERGIEEVRSEWLFGIMFCPAHRPEAHRDLHAYFHDEGLVRVGDALTGKGRGQGLRQVAEGSPQGRVVTGSVAEFSRVTAGEDGTLGTKIGDGRDHPEGALATLLTFWRDCGESLPVRRSSGVLEPTGWTLNVGTPGLADRAYLARNATTGAWHLPVLRADGTVSKSVRLADWWCRDPEAEVLVEGLAAARGHTPQSLRDLAAEAVEVLDRGFYLADESPVHEDAYPQK
jgi:hypothetical protein